MSLITALILLLLPTIGVILGGGLGWMVAAGMLANKAGLALPHLMRLIWENLLDALPTESSETASLLSTRPTANRQFALYTDWLIRLLQAWVQRRPAEPYQFPVTALLRVLLSTLALIWVAILVYVLAYFGLGLGGRS